MNNQSLSQEIVKLVGGKDNIEQLTHCATRLRFTLTDSKKADSGKLKQTEGVLGVINQGGQFQVIIGNEVARVYDEIENIILAQKSSYSEINKNREKQNLFNRFFSIISSVFTPILPAITGAGMLKAVLALLVLFKWINTSSQTYYIINFISDATFYFLPFLLAYTASQKFKTNPILSMVMAGVLLHPNLIALKDTGDPVELLMVPLKISTYSASVIPIILIVYFMSYVERITDKVIPSIIKFFIKPLVIILVTGVVGLLILAPLGSFIGDIFANLINFLNEKIPWFVPSIVGGISPFLVMTGMHYSLTPLASISLTSFGMETIIGPGMLASNIAQGANALVVAFKTKSNEQKEQASSAGFTALLGITEPALYGVTVKVKNSFIPVVVGGTVGGLYAGLTGLVRYAFGAPGLASLPVYIGENPKNILYACITILISFVTTAIVSWFVVKVEPEENLKEEKNEQS